MYLWYIYPLISHKNACTYCILTLTLSTNIPWKEKVNHSWITKLPLQSHPINPILNGHAIKQNLGFASPMPEKGLKKTHNSPKLVVKNMVIFHGKIRQKITNQLNTPGKVCFPSTNSPCGFQLLPGPSSPGVPFNLNPKEW